MLIAQCMIAFVAVFAGIGGLMFDAVLPSTARQHLRNPNWPPHAKFHNGQTMLMGLCNAMITIALLVTLPANTASLLLAAAVAESYFACMLLATIFPNTAWCDPEFEAWQPKPFGLPIQKFLAILATLVVVIAVVITLY